MKIGILTYGCAVNKSDSELMATLLADAGYEVLLDSEEPDIIVVNTCIVKGPTENKILRKLMDLGEEGKRVIISGCMPSAYPHLIKRFPDFAAIGTNNFDIVEVLEEYLGGLDTRRVAESEQKVLPKTIRYNNYVDILPISEGCLGACSYCATRLARGKLRSYDPKALLSEIEKSVGSGAKEIWLTSQDNGCYGFDIGTNLAGLLKEVVNVPGDFKVRVGMMNPSHVLGFLDELVEVYKDDNIFKFAHIPVQSGSDKVLKEMCRGYTTSDFEEILSVFRSEMDITISTDIIVGFPTETETDFKETVEFLKLNKPDFLNLSKYWPRKKTPAGEMRQLPRGIVSARSKEVADLFSEMLSKRKNLIGSECGVTFTEEKGEFSVGRNLRYQPVLVRGRGLPGKTFRVKIIDKKANELIGKVC
jgi:threonylcarbamoyladenosine tRNA methylthiotransferase CDKAL1